MSIGNLFYWSYWFEQPYIAAGWTLAVWVGGFLALVLAGLVMRILRQKKVDNLIKEVYRRFSNIGFVMGLWGLFWMFLRQERIPFLAWRFWLWFWVLVFVWWLQGVLKYTIKRLPEIRQERIDRETRNKYLPGKK